MRIVYYPDPVLMKPAKPVGTAPENIEEIVSGMREVMELERGIGLAAPQVGLLLRIICVNETGEPGDEEILLDPEIVKFHGKKEWAEEGCLSFPGIWGDVLRHTNVDVEFTDLEGARQTLAADGLLARVLQHEIDHLDGKIFVTKMRDSDKRANKKRLDELKARYDRKAVPPA